MDDDDEQDSDNDYDPVPEHLSPFPDNCINENNGIELLFVCFMRRYNACPALFMGSLRDACEKAELSYQHCPVLVYIHHDKSLLSNIFCLNVFCTEIIIDYLLENYIVWPWDITYESNRNRLIQIWKDLFPKESSLNFSMEQCPMLIGITKKSEYEFVPLLTNDTLIRTQEKFDRQSVLNELSLFREEFDAFSSELITRTGLSWEIIAEICSYLSLNDAIKAFSNHVLFYLCQSKTKLHITEPCPTLFQTITQRIKSEQIVALCLNTDDCGLPMFNQVISLTLLNLQVLQQVNQYEIYFPQLTRLSLRYDNEIGFNILKNVLPCLPQSIIRFEIHCAGALCTHYDEEKFNMLYECNYNVKYFLLDMGRASLISRDECFQHHSSCFLTTTIDLMKYMRNLRYFHLIINQDAVKKLLDINDWKNLFYQCFYLKKIILQVLGNTSNDELLLQKIFEIQKRDNRLQPKIEFQVMFN